MRWRRSSREYLLLPGSLTSCNMHVPHSCCLLPADSSDDVLGCERQAASTTRLRIVYPPKMLCCLCSHRKRELEGFFEADGPLTLAWFYQVSLACSPAVHICCSLSCTLPA